MTPPLQEEPEEIPCKPIKAISALWPEVPWPVINVLVEGPSIKRFDREDLLYGPTIAVNHALSIPGLDADFWATTDNPMNLWQWSLPFRTEELRFFTTDQNVGVWHELLGKTGIRRVYSHHLTQMGLETPDGMPIILPTLIALLGWLSRQKVRRVRLFGCDMKGKGSPLSGGWAAKADPNWESRWKVERILLAYTMRAYRTSGMRIERWPTSLSSTRARSRATSS